MGAASTALVSLVNPKFMNFSKPILLAVVVGICTLAGVIATFLVLVSAEQRTCTAAYPIHVGPYSTIPRQVGAWMTPPPASEGVRYNMSVCFRYVSFLEQPSNLYPTTKIFSSPCKPVRGFMPHMRIYNPLEAEYKTLMPDVTIEWRDGLVQAAPETCEAWTEPQFTRCDTRTHPNGCANEFAVVTSWQVDTCSITSMPTAAALGAALGYVTYIELAATALFVAIFLATDTIKVTNKALDKGITKATAVKQVFRDVVGADEEKNKKADNV